MSPHPGPETPVANDAPDVAPAEAVLKHVLGPTYARLRPDRWTRRLDPDGRLRYVLELQDDTVPSAFEVEFSPDEMNSEEVLHRKIRGVWGDLLQDRLDGIITKMRSLVGQEGAP